MCVSADGIGKSDLQYGSKHDVNFHFAPFYLPFILEFGEGKKFCKYIPVTSKNPTHYPTCHLPKKKHNEMSVLCAACSLVKTIIRS